jgi:signal transduction histidine kinase
MNERLGTSVPPAAPDAIRQSYIAAINLWMGVATTCLLLPFAIYNATQGRVAVGAAMIAITALFASNMIAVLRRRPTPVPMLFIYFLSVGAITLSTFTYRGLQGVIWAYPALVLFHFMASRKAANILNGVLTIYASVLAYQVVGGAMAARVGGTLALTMAFTNIFSHALEAANRALDETRAHAERANLAKSQFLANMSHELRTPLNAIIGYTEILHEDAQAEQRAEVARDLERIGVASRHLLQMIDEILDLARIEASRIDLNVTAVTLPRFVDELADAARPLARKNNNALAIELANEARELPLQADVTRLRQCMLNLLSNACKFTESGSVTLRVAPAELNGAAGVVFSVQDTGIGMTVEELARVFRPFEQADASTARRFGGTGLGLAITSELIRLMGGEIDAYSAPGKGSTFTLTLPLSAAPAAPAERNA